MWVGDTVYFLSDRDGRVTLYSYDTRAKKVARLFDNDGLDLKSASAGPGAIVYEQFGSLGLYDLQAGKRSRVPVTVAGDFPEVRERLLRVGTALTNAHVSPDGARAPSSRRTARSSPCRPRRATRATSPTRRA